MGQDFRSLAPVRGLTRPPIPHPFHGLVNRAATHTTHSMPRNAHTLVQVVTVRNDDTEQRAAAPGQIAATLKAFFGPDNPRTEDGEVTRCLEALADLDEARHVGRDKRPRHKPLGQLLHWGLYDKLAHAEELAAAVAAALARVERWLDDNAESRDRVAHAELCVRVLRAAGF
jgi:hypothetical protein